MKEIDYLINLYYIDIAERKFILNTIFDKNKQKEMICKMVKRGLRIKCAKGLLCNVLSKYWGVSKSTIYRYIKKFSS